MWARIEKDKVVEITDVDPTGRFNDSLIWLPCEDEVEEGWSYNGDMFLPKVQDISELQAITRTLRNAYLNETQWLLDRNRDEEDAGISRTLTDTQLTELLTYRQLLRDYPQTKDFPDPGKLPSKPVWLSSYD